MSEEKQQTPYKKALEAVNEAGQAISLIDETLVYLDQILDDLQPHFEAGKIRIIFRRLYGQDVPVFIKTGQPGKRYKQITVGQAAKNVRRTKTFQKYAAQVRAVCVQGEKLLEVRRSINAALGNLTASIKGRGQQFINIQEVTLAALLTLNAMGVSKKTVEEHSREGDKFKSHINNENAQDDYWIEDGVQHEHKLGIENFDDSELSEAHKQLVEKVFGISKKP